MPEQNVPEEISSVLSYLPRKPYALTVIKVKDVNLFAVFFNLPTTVISINLPLLKFYYAH